MCLNILNLLWVLQCVNWISGFTSLLIWLIISPESKSKLKSLSFEVMPVQRNPAHMHFYLCNKNIFFDVAELACTWHWCASCAPDAWLTGPSKNWIDINRLGGSHVSVYTGRPQSSTTRALDSLHTANSHTIRLCLVQKHSLISKHTQHVGMQKQSAHIYAEMQPLRWVWSLSYLLPRAVIVWDPPCFHFCRFQPRPWILHFCTLFKLCCEKSESSHRAIRAVLNSVLQHYQKASQKV